MWLACHTQEEIAEALNCDRSLISKMEEQFVNFGNPAIFHKSSQPYAEHLIDFDMPI